jgi:hypothetical protein
MSQDADYSSEAIFATEPNGVAASKSLTLWKNYVLTELRLLEDEYVSLPDLERAVPPDHL